jgi:uncharacterized protein (TIGR02594 family)
MDPLNLPLPWILEAKKHIGLKEIPGPKHNVTILAWLSQLKAWWKEDETPWCFTGDTQLFTDKGWVRFDKLVGDEKVYQVNNNNELSLTSSWGKVEKDYIGSAFHINHRSINLICDEKHRWWGHFGKINSVSRFGTLDEIGSNGLFIESVKSTGVGTGLSLDNLWFLAAFLSDGKVRYSESKSYNAKEKPINIEFEVSRQRKIDQLHTLGPEHFYVQNKAYGPLTKTPLSVFRFKYPDYFNKCLSDYKRLSSSFINNLTSEEAKIFLQAYATFDGNGDLFNSTVLYSSDEDMVNDLLAISVIAGYQPSIQINKYGSELTKKKAYRIVFSPNKTNRHIRKDHIQKIPYDGKMFCVKVPEGRIIVKRSDSAPIVTGNCGTYVAHCFRVSNLKIPKFWMRAKDWSNGWGIRLDKAMPGCVVVFERQGGGHVGFFLGVTKSDELVVLGGNQSNMVNIAKFSKERLIGYYWPKDYPNFINTPIPTLVVSGSLSVNEA